MKTSNLHAVAEVLLRLSIACEILDIGVSLQHTNLHEHNIPPPQSDILRHDTTGATRHSVSGIPERDRRASRPTNLVKSSVRRVAVATALLLVACSGGGGDGPTPPVSQPDPAPVASSVTPTTIVAGVGATTISVSGSAFVSRTVLNWNGSPRATTIQGATLLVATLTPQDLATAGTGSITLYTSGPGGGTSGPLTLAIVNPAPVLAAVTPLTIAAGSAATTITVTGSGFTATSRVHWNGAERPTTFVSSTSLTATVSAADAATAGSGAVTVVTAAPGGGTSAAINISITNPTPVVTAVSPSVITAGSPAPALVVTGTNFTAASRVHWNGTERPTTFTSATSLSAVLTASDVAAAGSANVTVVTPAPGGGTSNALAVSIQAPLTPAPTLSVISPTGATVGGAAVAVTLTGTNFTSNTVARWNGMARATTFVNSTTLTMAVTAADIATAGTGNITVFTPAPGGGQSASQPFAITAPLSFDPFTHISAGFATTCQIGPAGSARCWGSSAVGQVGDGQLGVRTTPSNVNGGFQFRTIAAQGSNSCGVSTANALYCWGRYTTSVFSPTNSATPVAIALPEPALTVATSSDPFLCILSVSKSVWCRSNTNSNGQLGQGNTAAATGAFGKVIGNHLFEAIALGRFHACGLKDSGEAFCWGSKNGAGRAGAPTANPTPMPIDGGQKFVRITAGESHSCALTAAGEAWCWGSTIRDALGAPGGYDGAPIRVSGNHRFSSISAAQSHTCAIDLQGAAWCWGEGTFGRTGRVDEASSTTPALVDGQGAVFTEVTAGDYHSCAINSAGSAWCWGSEEYARLGNTLTTWVDQPTAIAGTSGFTEIDATEYRTCALRNNGAVYCWGPFAAGVTGATSAAMPTAVSAPRAFVSVTSGARHACALEGDGSAWCWGNGADGKLGAGSTTSSSTPVRAGSALTFTQLSAGFNHNCGIVSGQGAFCWGDGAQNVLGNGSTNDVSTPTFVTGSAAFTQAAAGHTHSCALNSGGQAFCWGYDFYGALGLGVYGGSATPAPTNTGVRFTSLAAGDGLTCARTAASAGYCWGINLSGRRGFATGIPQDAGFSPTVLPGGQLWTALAKGGEQHNCGITAGSTLRCWGGNEEGQLGIPRSGANVPYTTVPGAFKRVTTGSTHTCALDSAGVIYCWGERVRGSLGDGLLGYRHVAVRVGQAPN